MKDSKQKQLGQSIKEQLSEDVLYGLAVAAELGQERKISLEKSRGFNLVFGAVALAAIVLWGGRVGETVRTIYLVQNADGSVQQVEGYNGPRRSRSDVRSFALKAATYLHEWKYDNYPQRFDEALDMFREDVLNQYVESLFSKGVFDTAENRLQEFTALLDSTRKGVRIVNDKQTSDGGHFWFVDVPLTEELRDTGGRKVNHWKVSLRIDAVGPNENLRGLKVTRIFEELVK